MNYFLTLRQKLQEVAKLSTISNIIIIYLCNKVKRHIFLVIHHLTLTFGVESVSSSCVNTDTVLLFQSVWFRRLAEESASVYSLCCMADRKSLLSAKACVGSDYMFKGSVWANPLWGKPCVGSARACWWAKLRCCQRHHGNGQSMHNHSRSAEEELMKYTLNHIHSALSFVMRRHHT